MSTPRSFAIFLADGSRHLETAPSLRKALRKFGRETSIVAAIESACLPTPEQDSRPFLAVFLSNPRFARPDER